MRLVIFILSVLFFISCNTSNPVEDQGVLSASKTPVLKTLTTAQLTVNGAAVQTQISNLQASKTKDSILNLAKIDSLKRQFNDLQQSLVNSLLSQSKVNSKLMSLADSTLTPNPNDFIIQNKVLSIKR